MKIKELIEHYIRIAENRTIGIQLIKKNTITEKMGTIKFILANRCFVNYQHMISHFKTIEQIFTDIYKQTNTKFKIECKEGVSICKVLIIL